MASMDMSLSLECCVCLNTYNLRDRRPRALACQHTICDQCVEQLKHESFIRCPRCRQPSKTVKLPANFALEKVMQSLCEECFSKPQTSNCAHCGKKICGQCLEVHREKVFEELKLGLKKLDQVLHQANDVSNDRSFVDQQHQKEQETIEEIQQAIQCHKDALDKLEQKLEAEVRATKQRNLDAFLGFNSLLNQNITNARQFSLQTGIGISRPAPIQYMAQQLNNCSDLIDKLDHQIQNRSAFADYEFVKSEDCCPPLSIGEIRIKSDVMNIEPQPEPTEDSGVPDYTTLRYENLILSQGSGNRQQDKPSSVLCTSDQIIVSDERNHTVKFYDTNLELQYVMEEKGDVKRPFCFPSGLAAGPQGQVFLSDRNNHRIVVLTSRGEFLREFGSHGSADDQFDCPQGLAIRDDLVFIADTTNNRVKVVNPDGTFVRQIRSSCVNRVAVLSSEDGHILVTSEGKTQLKVYSSTGEYQGVFPPKIPNELCASRINDMTVDATNNVIITYHTGRLAVYDPHGDLITVTGSAGTRPGQFRYPRGVSVNTPTRRVAVCEFNNNRVQLFSFDMK